MTDKHKGLFFAITGTTLWGISGVVAQYLFSRQPIEPGWLVGMRLAVSGVLLVIWGAVSNFHELISIWRDRHDWLLLIVFALFGMITSQFSYFMAIKYGNAPTATILQFLGPVFIIVFLALRYWRLPRQIDVISMLIALFGTYLLVTKGSFDSLRLAPTAVFWGLGAAISQALYTLIPIQLLKKYDAKIVTGWAMLLGSLVFLPHMILTPMPHLNVSGWVGVIFVATVGTMFAYLLYLKSLNYILPATTGMLSSFEPLTATFLSIVVLHTAFGLPEMLGGAMILATAFLQALAVSIPKESIKKASH